MHGAILTVTLINLLATLAIIVAMYVAYVKARSQVPKLMPLLEDKINGVETQLSTALNPLTNALTPLSENITAIRADIADIKSPSSSEVR